MLEKKWEYKRQNSYSSFKKAYDLVRSEVLYKILIEFLLPMTLVRLFTICLKETFTTKVSIGKHFYDRFPVQNGLK
jgi:hypothetical protein